MKRLFISMLAISLIISSILPYSSAALIVKAADKKASEEKTTEETKNTEKKTSTSKSNASYKAAYYDMESLPKARGIDAPACILMDPKTGAVLYQKNADEMHYPASTTKVMTALLAIENCNMDDIVTFTKEAVTSIPSDSSTAGVNVGAQLTVEDCLYLLLLQSANEVANALAEHIAGSVDDFPDMMNARAKELGCTGTHFANAHGYWQEDHYTTARDMSKIMTRAIKHKDFRRIAGTVKYTVENDTLNDTIYLVNHSKILRKDTEFYYEFAKASKTGYTDVARHTLVTYAKKGDVNLVCVVLEEEKSMDYLDTAALFRWGFEQVKAIRPLQDIKLKSLINACDDLNDKEKAAYNKAETSYNKDYYLLLSKDFDVKNINTSFEADDDKSEKRLGYIVISSGKDEIGRTPVTYEGTISADPNKKVAGDGDGLETAPNKHALTPGKVLKFFFKIILAVILITVIMFVIRTVIDRNNAKKELGRRSKARSQRRRSTTKESNKE